MTGCEILKCPDYKDGKCTNELDYVSKIDGSRMCYRNEDAIPRDEIEEIKKRWDYPDSNKRDWTMLSAGDAKTDIHNVLSSLEKEKERGDRAEGELKEIKSAMGSDQLLSELLYDFHMGMNKAEERVKELVEAVERYKNIRDGLRSDVEEVMGSAEIPYYEQELYKVLEEAK